MRPLRHLCSLPWAQVVAIAATAPLFSVDVAQASMEGEQGPPSLLQWIAAPNSHEDAAGELRSWIEIKGVELVGPSKQAGQVLIIKGSLPTPCHRLAVEIPPTASADGALRLQAWSISQPSQICAQVVQPFSAQIPLGSLAFSKVIVNEGLEADPADSVGLPQPSGAITIPEVACAQTIELTPLQPCIDPIAPISFQLPIDETTMPPVMGNGPAGPITATPGPLPVAAALAGWHSARRLRRRCRTMASVPRH
ncbi:MAG: hypothetical protein RLZZ609_1355 [Cyanobacteriota bacterium]|jgi:hypothetical protein